MNKTIDMMAQILEKNNIPLPNGTREKEACSNFKGKERFHALMANTSKYSSFIIDYKASKHMESTREYVSSLDYFGGPIIVLEDESETESKVKGRMSCPRFCIGSQWSNHIFHIH